MTGQCFGFGNGRFGHPEQHRAISLREAAILQTFPRTYEFIEPGSAVYMKSVGRMIGNAVPPLLGEVIGKSIVRHIREKNIVGNN
jgi:DNA (cytosine-5)-methyltransferase 1